jgi:hypothetical protein
MSCDTYYNITSTEDIYLYNSPSKSDNEKDVIVIPAGTYYYSTFKKKRFRKAKYGNVKGYVYNPYFDNPYYSPRNSNSQSTSTSTSTPRNNYSSSSSTTSYPKTVNVKGYYRRDGTYVRPHTRSAPRRR